MTVKPRLFPGSLEKTNSNVNMQCALQTRTGIPPHIAVQFIPPDLIFKQILYKVVKYWINNFPFFKTEKVKTRQRSYVYVQLIINLCVLVGYRYIAQRQFTLV
ncbi:Hypothetical_protein [Hexamita inflata]|uniref:Hypothetical_protein n=1 Tax=Hexamita inflata TaxID=28002 RepID=A0AA86NAS9_9EUKA|nr:Hypothetical protein HINF_LOCUS3628 [Hexamita inflata]